MDRFICLACLVFFTFVYNRACKYVVRVVQLKMHFRLWWKDPFARLGRKKNEKQRILKSLRVGWLVGWLQSHARERACTYSSARDKSFRKLKEREISRSPTLESASLSSNSSYRVSTSLSTQMNHLKSLIKTFCGRFDRSFVILLFCHLFQPAGH